MAIKLSKSFAVILFMLGSTLVLFSGEKAFAQAGCGNEMGPPAPGTICPDGTIPIPDSSLPLGCPGTAQQGPFNPNAEINCPARPGRDACTLQNGRCVTASGRDVTAGNGVQQTSGERNEIEADCTESASAADCGITRYLVLFINILSVMAGIVIAGSIAYGGIEYSMSGSDPQRVSAAKDRIKNAIIALVVFIFGYSFLNFLIPGGLL